MNQLGKYLVILGAIMMVAGMILWFMGDKLNWLGKLPGDFRVENENVKFYFPLTTMVLLSVVISLIIRLIQYFR